MRESVPAVVFLSVPHEKIRRILSGIVLSILLLPTLAHTQATTARIKFDLPAQSLADTLRQLGDQGNVNIFFDPGLVAGKRTSSINETLTVDQALTKVLEGTGLTPKFVDEHTVTLIDSTKATRRTVGSADAASSSARPNAAIRLAQQDSTQTTESPPSGQSVAENEATLQAGIPEILVRGKQTLNSDIQRTEDDVQPYVVFGKDEIQQSQAVNLADFLKTRLPMNSAAASNSQAIGSSNPTSSITLRGLSSGNTLILVDGRRLPDRASAGNAFQPDINGIPLGAIERIEILPSTAGGIYGGNATGGVINIILRRDFRGLEGKVTYLNTFATNTANMQVDLAAGFSLESGRTQVMIAATRSKANPLRIGDRNFTQRAIARQLKNNPDSILNAGFPPLGATVNIGSDSGDLVLDEIYGGTPLGSAITHVPLGYAGPASDSGAGLVANAGTFNLDLPDDMNGRRAGLLAAPSIDSASLDVRRDFGEHVQAFVDAATLTSRGETNSSLIPNYVFELPADAPNNPFQQPINVYFPTPGPGLAPESVTKATTVRGTAGVIVRLPHRWTGEVDYGWSRSSFLGRATVFAVDAAALDSLATGLPAPDGRPALDALQEGNTFPLDFTPYRLPSPNTFLGPFKTMMKDAVMRASGPIAELPGGSLTLSGLIERREESLQKAFLQQINIVSADPLYTYYPPRSQDVNSYYLEARLPVVSSRNARTLARDLEIQASVRRDDYKTRSDGKSGYPVASHDGPFPAPVYTAVSVHSTDFTVGLRYSPLEDVALRASLGTGFLPPSVTQIAQKQSFGIPGGLDPKRGNTPMYVSGPFTWLTGGNPELQPEESRSWSVGMIMTPRFAPGLRLSLDYTQIKKSDEIQTPAVQFLLDNESMFPERIVRGANLPGDQPGWAGPVISFDQTLLNVAKSWVKAYDIQADYTFSTQRAGEFHGYALASWQPHYRNQVLPTALSVENVGYTNGPLEWRGNFGINWSRGPLSIGWNAQYYDSYHVYLPGSSADTIAFAVLSQGSAKIPHQTYHDLVATYRLDDVRFAGRIFAHTEISLGIQNLLNTSPPIVATAYTYEPGYSPFGNPLLRRYSISLRKSIQ